MTLVHVERTYLQLLDRSELQRGAGPSQGVVIVELRPCPIEVSRRLYREVGEHHHWRDRLAYSDAQLREYLANDGVRVFVARSAHGDEGFFELVRHDDGSVEIAYFGLLPRAQGRGLGKWLLVEAADRAFDWGAARVWLHTCTLDSPAALPNYRARGFVPYDTLRYSVEIPAEGA